LGDADPHGHENEHCTMAETGRSFHENLLPWKTVEVSPTCDGVTHQIERWADIFTTNIFVCMHPLPRMSIHAIEFVKAATAPKT
jgi:hypothetical protein